MSKTATIRARTEPELKKNVDRILHKIGLNESDAINIFFKQIELFNGIPFPIKVPNAITKKTFNDTDNALNVKKFSNIDEMFKSLNF